jgi:NAD(P)-dependent dehydrogenase (short-subunit alcohol dehydrogenase family)
MEERASDVGTRRSARSALHNTLPLLGSVSDAAKPTVTVQRPNRPHATFGARPTRGDRGDGRSGTASRRGGDRRAGRSPRSRAGRGVGDTYLARAGRLDILVNDVWGADPLIEWNVPVWEHSLAKGQRMLRLAIDTHVITSLFALPLLIKHPAGLVIEMTDGTAEYNADHYRLSLFYDLAKTSITRIAWALSKELEPHRGTGIALTPGWLRSEQARTATAAQPGVRSPHRVITTSRFEERRT